MRRLAFAAFAWMLAAAAHGDDPAAEAREHSEAPAAAGAEAAPQYRADAHYALLDAPDATPADADAPPEVLDFFWYGCPHCFSLEPHLAEWIEAHAATARVRHVPAVFSKRWVPGARLYYALEELERLDLHAAVFRLVHEQGRPLKSADGIARMLEPFGLDPDAFAAAFRGEAVSAKVKAAEELPGRYGITGVPALVVAGRYLVTTRHAGGDHPEMLAIAGWLLETRP